MKDAFQWTIQFAIYVQNKAIFWLMVFALMQFNIVHNMRLSWAQENVLAVSFNLWTQIILVQWIVVFVIVLIIAHGSALYVHRAKFFIHLPPTASVKSQIVSIMILMVVFFAKKILFLNLELVLLETISKL